MTRNSAAKSSTTGRLPPRSAQPRNNAVHLVERLAAVLVVVATTLASLMGSFSIALGIAAGGLLATINFYALRVLLTALIASDHPKRQALLTAILLVKFALMGSLLYFAATWLPLRPVGMLIGVTIVVFSILVEGFRTALRSGSRDNPGTSTPPRAGQRVTE